MPAPIRKSIKGLSQYALLMSAVGLFLFLIVLPFSNLFTIAFEDGAGGFWEAINTKAARTAFTNSLIISIVVTLINMGVGILTAIVITRYHFPGRQLFTALIDMPIAIPTAVVGLSIMMLYGPRGFLGPIFTDNGIDIVLAIPGIVLANIIVTFPFMVRSVSVALEKLDPAQEEAAQTLGATKAQTFWHVTLPSIRGGLLAGIALTFTRSLSEFGSTLFVAGTMVGTGPIYIYTLSETDFNQQAATSVAIMMLIIPFVMLTTLTYLAERLEER